MLNLSEMSALFKKQDEQALLQRGREGVRFSVDSPSRVRSTRRTAERKRPDSRQREELESLIHGTKAQLSKLLPNLYRNMGSLERKTR